MQQSNDLVIENIWEVKRDSEDASLSSYSEMNNHRLLMDATSAASAIANIKNGLQIEPSRYRRRHGRGLYFQNAFDSMYEYLDVEERDDGNVCSIIFLAKVILGKTKVTHGYQFYVLSKVIVIIFLLVLLIVFPMARRQDSTLFWS